MSTREGARIGREETTAEKSLRFVRENPHVLGHVAKNLFADELGLPDGEKSTRWEALFEEAREEWRERALTKLADYAAASPDERATVDAENWRRLLATNDAAFPPASPPSPAAAPAKWNLGEWLTRESRHSSDCNANEHRVGYNADCICGAWRFVALAESRRTLQGELEEMREALQNVAQVAARIVNTADVAGPVDYFVRRTHIAALGAVLNSASRALTDPVMKSQEIGDSRAALSPKDGDPNE